MTMTYLCFCFIEPSPIVNLLKNVCLFIQIVNTMQSVLNLIVPSLTSIEEFQCCLQNQVSDFCALLHLGEKIEKGIFYL